MEIMQTLMCPTPDGNIPCEYIPDYLRILYVEIIFKLLGK